VSDVDGLAAWLRGALDDEERVARECLDEVGHCKAGEMYPDGSGPADRDDYPSYPWGSGLAELEFMRRHAPARELRKIEANRRILDYLDRVDKYEFDNDLWNLPDPDDVRRLLALPLADRPGYQESWRP
jgi:Family of unknown function (DUF6221)